MNDYELIYLIHNEYDEISLNFMFKKYHKFIWKQVHLLNIESKEHDDMYQEGVLILYKAIQTFNEAKNKTFTRYFELILKRRLYKIKKKIPNYYLYEHTNFCKGTSYIEEDTLQLKLSSKLEITVYESYFLNRHTVEQIEKETKYSRKKIYNAIFRIKEKYKVML